MGRLNLIYILHILYTWDNIGIVAVIWFLDYKTYYYDTLKFLSECHPLCGLSIGCIDWIHQIFLRFDVQWQPLNDNLMVNELFVREMEMKDSLQVYIRNVVGVWIRNLGRCESTPSLPIFMISFFLLLS